MHSKLSKTFLLPDWSLFKQIGPKWDLIDTKIINTRFYDSRSYNLLNGVLISFKPVVNY